MFRRGRSLCKHARPLLRVGDDEDGPLDARGARPADVGLDEAEEGDGALGRVEARVDGRAPGRVADVVEDAAREERRRLARRVHGVAEPVELEPAQAPDLGAVGAGRRRGARRRGDERLVAEGRHGLDGAQRPVDAPEERAEERRGARQGPRVVVDQGRELPGRRQRRQAAGDAVEHAEVALVAGGLDVVERRRERDDAGEAARLDAARRLALRVAGAERPAVVVDLGPELAASYAAVDELDRDRRRAVALEQRVRRAQAPRPGVVVVEHRLLEPRAARAARREAPGVEIAAYVLGEDVLRELLQVARARAAPLRQALEAVHAAPAPDHAGPAPRPDPPV
mmetsp:Transcript_25824/g.83493  ORF Transcript_25824/g.83493 Transcript_25824/m.83493 type:complete len:340 (-) Transcript_25824:52-1071(-)